MVVKKLAGLCVAVGSVVLVLAPGLAGAEPAFYRSPLAAVDALLDAASSDDTGALRVVLGPQVEELHSGDPVSDAADRERFASAAAQALRIEAVGDQQAHLSVGPDDWPFPIPIVKEAQGWRFDTAAGKEELLNRRVGRNELLTIAIVREGVEAQHEYADRDPQGAGVRQYAQRFRSSEGARDGLYWEAAEGEPESPLGPLIAGAVAEGYKLEGGQPVPYHGYYYRLLTGQGESAPGGAMSYLRDGRMTEGFAILAYPAEYGRSGIMTFVADARGRVFQKDLGKETGTVASATTQYDPDRSWSPVIGD